MAGVIISVPSPIPTFAPRTHLAANIEAPNLLSSDDPDVFFFVPKGSLIKPIFAPELL